MRYALAAVILAITTGSVSAAPAPKKDCSAAFVAQWSHNREAALRHMPKDPCWMHSPTGGYVCYRDGCVRGHVYLNSD